MLIKLPLASFAPTTVNGNVSINTAPPLSIDDSFKTTSGNDNVNIKIVALVDDN